MRQLTGLRWKLPEVAYFGPSRARNPVGRGPQICFGEMTNRHGNVRMLHCPARATGLALLHLLTARSFRMDSPFN